MPGAGSSIKGSCGIVPFFTEFFHEDHGSNNVAAVVMDKGLPSADVEALLADPRLSIGVTYLDGDLMDDKVRSLLPSSIELIDVGKGGCRILGAVLVAHSPVYFGLIPQACQKHRVSFGTR